MASKLARRRTVTYSLAAAFLAVVVVGSGVTVAAYKWDWGGDDESPCPSPREATGVSQPEKVDPKGDGAKLKVVDEGLRPYSRSSDEAISFGVILENTTDTVLHDAVVSVAFVDSDGNDPTELYRQDVFVGDDRAKFDDIAIAYVMPGQKTGFGGLVKARSEYISVTKQKMIKMDKIDYDDLTVEVTLKHGEWWPPKNDVYVFNEAEANNIEHLDSFSEKEQFLNGDEMVNHKFSYTVDVDSCQDQVKHGSSAVVYENDELVGGRLPGGFGMSIRNGSDAGIRISGPEDVEAKVFPSVLPTAPT